MSFFSHNRKRVHTNFKNEHLTLRKKLGLNEIYIITNYYYTHFECDRTIGPALCHLKWPFIRGFIFVSIIIIEHGFIFDLISVVYYFIIIADVIFINLPLIFPTYYLQTRSMFNWENHITDK